MVKTSNQNSQSAYNLEFKLYVYSKHSAEKLLTEIEEYIAPQSSWLHWLPFGSYKVKHRRQKVILQGMAWLQEKYFSGSKPLDKDQILGEWCSLAEDIKNRWPRWGFKKSLLKKLSALQKQFKNELPSCNSKFAELIYVCPNSSQKIESKYAQALASMSQKVESLIRGNEQLVVCFKDVLPYKYPVRKLTSLAQLRKWHTEYAKTICTRLVDTVRLKISSSLISNILSVLADKNCHLNLEPFLESCDDLEKVRDLTNIYLQIDVPVHFMPFERSELLIIPPLRGKITESYVIVQGNESGLGLCIGRGNGGSRVPKEIVKLINHFPKNLNVPYLLDLNQRDFFDNHRLDQTELEFLKRLLCLQKVGDRLMTLFEPQNCDVKSAVKAVQSVQQLLHEKIVIVEDGKPPFEVKFSDEPCHTVVVTQGISIKGPERPKILIHPESYVSAGRPREELIKFISGHLSEKDKNKYHLIDVLRKPEICVALSKPNGRRGEDLEKDVTHDIRKFVSLLTKRAVAAPTNHSSDELVRFELLINSGLSALDLKILPVGKKRPKLTSYEFDSSTPRGQECGYSRGIELFGKKVQSEKWIESLGPKPILWSHFDHLTEQVKQSGFQFVDNRSQIGEDLLKLFVAKKLSPRDEGVREICELIQYRLWPEPSVPFDDKRMIEVSSLFCDEVPLGHCLSISELSLVDSTGSLVVSRENGRVIKPKVVVSRGPKPQLLVTLENDSNFATGQLSDSISILGRDYDPRQHDWRTKLAELSINAINHFLTNIGDQLALVRHPLCDAVRRLLPELRGLFIFPPLEAEPTSRQYLMTFSTEPRRLPKVVKTWHDKLLLMPPQESVFSEKPSGEIDRVLSYSGVMMTNPASDSSEVAVFGQYAFIASKGIDRWRADLSQMAFKLLTAFPLDEKQSQISRSLLEELEKNSLGCHRLEKEAEIASNRHLFHFLNQLDWVSDTQSHLLPPDRSLEFLELREEIVQRLANEATIECAPQAIGADASTISIPCTKYRIPGSEGIVCEILRHQCSLAGRSLSDRAFIGIGYSGSVPKHWNTVQNIYFESRLNNGFDEVGLESLLLARDSYLKSGTALAILAIIQCAEMSCKELGERDERPAYRQAIDAGERILESECGLRRIGLRRWHTMPVGDKYSNYRIQYVQIPGRGRELVVRILSPAYENIKDGVCNNLGLVQITS